MLTSVAFGCGTARALPVTAQPLSTSSSGMGKSFLGEEHASLCALPESERGR